MATTRPAPLPPLPFAAYRKYTLSARTSKHRGHTRQSAKRGLAAILQAGRRQSGNGGRKIGGRTTGGKKRLKSRRALKGEKFAAEKRSGVKPKR